MNLLKKKCMMILISCLAFVGLASCGEVMIPDRCAGWEKIRISEDTAEYMNRHDRPGLASIIAHAEYGKSRRCWN